MAQNPTKKKKQRLSQIKGALFEIIVRKLLVQAKFVKIPPDGKNIRNKFRNVRGRACCHNIDAFGKYMYSIPYVYPIRLLAEAKCYTKKIRLPIVRNFVGVVKDISENYFINDRMSEKDILSYKRYTDCGSIFSTSDFSHDAQKFALAHGITLISYKNNPIIRDTVDSLKSLIPSIDVTVAAKNITDFMRYVDFRLSNPPRRIRHNKFCLNDREIDFYKGIRDLSRSLSTIRTSLIGISIGKDGDFQYPIHILSDQAFPEQIFLESDTRSFIPHFYTEVRGNGVVFDLEPVGTQVHLYFSLPRTIYQNYYDQNRMLEFKALYLNTIEIPIKIGNFKRIVRFELDQPWLDKQKRLMGE